MTTEEYDAQHHKLKEVRSGIVGGLKVYVAECWCPDWTSDGYIRPESATRAHERHAEKELGRDAMRREHR